MAIPSLAGLRTHLNMPAGHVTDDPELEFHLASATTPAEREVGPLGIRTFTERISYHGKGVVSRWPCVALVSIATAPPVGDPWPVTGGTLDRHGVLEISARTAVREWLTVVYTAGTADPPAAWEHAVYIIAEHLWELQRGPGGFAPDQGQGFAVPARAVELLAGMAPL